MISRRILAAVALLCVVLSPAIAQKSKTVLLSETAAQLPSNNVGAITPQILQNVLNDMINSWQQYGGVNAQLGTTYTVQVSDYGQLVTLNNGSSIAVTIPQPTGSFSTFSFTSDVTGAGSATFTSQNGATINSSPSISISKGQWAYFVSDGTGLNWVAITSGLAASQFVAGNCIAITGTTSPTIAVSGSGCITTSLISNNNITNALLAQMAGTTIKGNLSSQTANPADLSPGQVGSILCTPIRTIEISGTNATFNTPTCSGVLAVRLEIEMVGGGGGGAGSGTTPGAAGAGSQTCWNTSGTACSTPLFSANGGAGGQIANATASAGGTTASCDLGITGGQGNGAQNSTAAAGGAGGASFFGGQAPANSYTTAAATVAGLTAATNSGGGGSGAAAGGTAGGGGGGAGGGYCRKMILSPAGSYVFTVGTGGAGGTLGTSGSAGGSGAAGIIFIQAYWQ